jgi:hypothetical protein
MSKLLLTCILIASHTTCNAQHTFVRDRRIKYSP